MRNTNKIARFITINKLYSSEIISCLRNNSLVIVLIRKGHVEHS